MRVEAVPVEDMPCIDIWDAANEKVYSRCVACITLVRPPCTQCHSLTTLLNPQTKTTSANAPDGSKEWQDESGVYRDIRARLLGDFVLICRFGGKYARDEADPSKILFRYVGNTAFLVR